MSEGDSSYQIEAPEVFSRGGLMMTYELLRKKNPKLALNIRNISAGEPLPKYSSQVDNKNSDHFRVELDSFQVRAIVEGLMGYTQERVKGSTSSGMDVMAKALVEDWIALARKMISELPNNEKPR